MSITAADEAAVRRAVGLARAVPGRLLPNPRVGCVLLDSTGTTIAEGVHRGPGTAHAEVDALRQAGEAARGATAVVTLEPCNHTGRTGPCAQALIDAGVARVIYAVADPNPDAAGGAATLREAGIDVVLAPSAEAEALNHRWLTAIRNQRPFVTWKFAATLDGRSAAADGSSRWITSPEARRDAHRLRAEADVILAGTATVEIDDPELTVRDDLDRPIPGQPLRAVMGLRHLGPDRRVFDDRAETARLLTRDPAQALDQLWKHERRHVFLEGGPTLAAAFLRAGLIDEVVAYLAPALLGAGTPSVADLGVDTIADAVRLRPTDVTVLDGDAPNLRITLTTQHHKET